MWAKVAAWQMPQVCGLCTLLHSSLALVVRVEVVLHGLAPPALPEHLGLDLRLPALENRLARDHLQHSQPANTQDQDA